MIKSKYEKNIALCDECAERCGAVNLSAWVPAESDRLGIARELWFDYSNMIHGVLESRTLYIPDERAARERLDRIMEKPLSECRDEIQEMFIYFWSNWDGDVDDAAAGDPERAALYRKILGLQCAEEKDFDFSQWTPDEKRDRDAIVAFFRESYFDLRNAIGEHDDTTVEALALYKKVKAHPLEETKEEIQEYFADMCRCVSMQPEKYYAPYPELLRLIRLTVAPKRTQEAT